MKKLAAATLIVIFSLSIASAQSNKIVFGPLEGDDAGVLTVHNGEAIEIEMWVRTDPDNPAPIIGVSHCLMSADTIIASRNGATFDSDYGYPCWDTFVSPPFGHPYDPNIPEGHTIQVAAAIYTIFDPPCHPMDTNGEWDYYGAFLMTCNTGLPVDSTYYPFLAGWFPHSGQGTSWSFEAPPGGSVEPEQDYCGLFFQPETRIGQNEGLPEEFSLFQNHPNPFNTKTTIRYSLPEESDVTIEIYNILGRKIETLVSGIQPAGWHSMVWDAENRPSGVYFYWIKAGEYKESRSCLLLK